MDEKNPYRGLTIEFKSKGLDEFSDELREVNDVAKELEATLERVTSLIERISLANYETPSIREVSRRLYELEKESAQTDGAYHGLDIRLATRGTDGEVRL